MSPRRSHTLTCKLCNCCQFSGFGCHTWSRWMARRWRRSLPWLWCWLCHGSHTGSQLWPWLPKFQKNMKGAKRTGIFGKWKSSPCLNHTMSVSTDRVKNRAGIAWFKEKASWDQNRPEQPLSPASCTSPGEAGIMERAWVLPRWLLLMLIAFMMLQRNNWSLKKHYFI